MPEKGKVTITLNPSHKQEVYQNVSDEQLLLACSLSFSFHAGRVVDIYSKFDVIVSPLTSHVCVFTNRHVAGRPQLALRLCAEPGGGENLQQPGHERDGGAEAPLALLRGSDEVQTTRDPGDHRGPHRQG